MISREVLNELGRLSANARTVDLVMAALEGYESVERVLRGEASVPPNAGESSADALVPSVYLHDVAVAGFRGIGLETTLELPPGPGLTVVIGRNGSGKSSFAEGLEVLLTGDSRRWSDKRGPWRKGWRNLHHSSATKITARFQVEGKRGLTTLRAEWPLDSEFAESRRTAQHHGEVVTDLGGIGWKGPLDLYRPLLSYNELGMIGAGPSALFDTLTAVLGLNPLTDARKPLSEARLKRQRFEKQVKSDRVTLLAALRTIEDERAEHAVTALEKKNWDLDTLAGVESEPGSEQSSLRDLATLEVPDRAKVFEVAEQVESAYVDLSALAGAEPERAEHLVQLLQKAIDHYLQHGDEACPVCGVGVLDDAWRASTEEEIGRLQESAARYRDASHGLERAIRESRMLVAVPNLPPSEAVDTSALRTLWARWASLPEDAVHIPDHLLSAYERLATEAAQVSDRANSLYSEREEEWRRVSPGLAKWVAEARQAVASRDAVKQIRAAETALKNVTATLRSARWAPIEAKALTFWQALRLQSNVDLRSVGLVGHGPGRQVDLTVDIDGTEAPALAVVSQGEISCLALSLFFPRAMLSDSPFQFLVIDDPVQAMDPARVDGLARVFAEIAEDRQLMVFTHDDRLPEALRRLRIKHTCRKVTRGPESLVEVSGSHDPVTQYFADARALINDDALPARLARRVVPGLCRNGLEAACVEAFRRRRLGRGEAHAEVEQVLEQAKKLTQKAALTLFDDPRRGGRVSQRIRERWGASFEDAFWAANRGAHRPHAGNLRQLIDDCQALARRLRGV